MAKLTPISRLRNVGSGSLAGRSNLLPALASRYERCHPGDTFDDLCNRARFSKEDRRLLEDWLAVFGTGAEAGRAMVGPTAVNGNNPRGTIATVAQGSIDVDAAAIASGLGLEAAQVPELMRRGEITSMCEIGIGEDEGCHRLTFFFRNTRLCLVIDATGRLLERGAIRFGDKPLPQGLRRPKP